MSEAQPVLYGELAPWFHLMTSPDEYVLEAGHAFTALSETIGEPPATILELGSGGGNNAVHLKAHAKLTLTDLSHEMLDLSASMNPECEHIQGDMRSLRLGRTFDAVFVHDAISYMTTEEDLRAAIETAWAHLRPGGGLMLEPDHVRETFAEATDHGGHDGGSDDPRALRYLEWRWDPDPSDTWYVDDYAYLLREAGASVRTISDRHRLGLFPRDTWMRLLDDVGSDRVETRPSPYEDGVAAGSFLARKPV